MSLKCESRILKEYKTKKADVVLPMYCPNGIWIPTPDESPHGYWKGKLSDMEVCGGDVTVTLKAVDEPDYFSSHYAELQAEEMCSRCKWPWYKGREIVQNGIKTYDGWDITFLLEKL